MQFMQQQVAGRMAALQAVQMAGVEFPGVHNADGLGEMGQFLLMLLMFQGNTGVVPGRLQEKLLQVRQAHMELAEVCCLGMLSQNAAMFSLNVDLHHRDTRA